jgi:hypothetical protein
LDCRFFNKEKWSVTLRNIQGILPVSGFLSHLELLVDLLVLAGSIVDALTAARRRLLLRTGLALRRRGLTTFRHDFWCGFLFLVEKALGEV